MKTIAIIPARGGSKGIPKKNLYPICGKPLIQYCIESLQQSSVDDFFVSTDCKEIAEFSLKIGSKVIDRPAEISQDNSPTIDCINHAIDNLKLNQNDIILTIQATNPLISSKDIDTTIFKMRSGIYNTVAAYDSLTTNYGDQFRGEIMLDQFNNIVVASCTRSTDFPTVSSFQAVNAGQQDGVVFKVQNDFSSLLFSSYYGGTEMSGF